MRKITLIMLMTILCSFLFAEKKVVGILAVKANDSNSKYLAKRLDRIDFKKLLKKHAEYELANQKKLGKIVKKAGFTNADVIGSKEAMQIVDQYPMDLAMWVTIYSNSKSEFTAFFRVLDVKTKVLNTERFMITKKNEQRMAAFQTNIVDKFEEFSGGELKKLIQLAQQSYASKNYSMAKKQYKSVLEMDPENIDAYFYLGYINYAMQNYESAISYYEKGLAKAEDKARFYNYIAKVYEDQEDIELAVEVLNQLANETKDVKVYLRIVTMYEKQMFIEDYEPIVEALNAALELDPENGVVNGKLGNVYYAQDLFNDAIPYLEKASENLEDDSLVANNLATAYIKTNRIDSAIENYKSLIEKNPNKEKNYIRLASAYRTTNNYKDGIQILLKLIEINSQKTDYYNRLAEMYQLDKNYAKADEYLGKSLAIESNQYKPYKIRGDILFKRGYDKYAKFLDYETKAKEAYGDEADRLIAQRDKTKKEANGLFKKALENMNQVIALNQNLSAVNAAKKAKKDIKTLIKETEKGVF